jgi:hypothetical protein
MRDALANQKTAEQRSVQVHDDDASHQHSTRRRRPMEEGVE